MGLYVLLDLRHFGAPYAGVASQAVGNALVGVMAFQVDRAGSRSSGSAARGARSPACTAVKYVDMIDAHALKIAAAITHRLSVLQYAVVVLFVAARRRLLGLPDRRSTRSSRRWRRTTTSGRLPLRAPRGVLFDRNGKVLVENRPPYNISIVREHTKDLDRTIRLLAAVARRSTKPRVRQIVDRHRREPTYRPIVVIEDATLAQVAAVTARRLDFELPDVLVQQVPTRKYPTTMAAHLFGYVGEVNDAQVADDDALKSGDIVGQAGSRRSTTRC